MKNATASYGVFGWWMELALYIVAEGMKAEWNHISEKKLFGEVAWANTQKTKMLFGCLCKNDARTPQPFPASNEPHPPNLDPSILPLYL